MPEALLDSNVVVGARLKRDQWHDPGRAIVRGIDSGDLPRGRLTNYHLPEILNPIEARAGDAPAQRTLEFVTESRGLDVQQTTRDDYTRGLALYRREANVEVVDCIVVAHMRRTGLEYVYSFDDDFDRFDGIARLATPTNPFDAS